MLFLIRFLCGYVNVCTSGEFAERIINVCAKNSITIWNIKYKKQKIYFSLSIKDFTALRIAKRGICVKIHILNKAGLPFIIAKHRQRKGIAIGIVLFFAIIIYLSGFIWVINIDGNTRVDKKYILNNCANIGIKTGIKKNGFVPKNKRDEFLINTDKFSWASFNIQGSVLTVELKDATDKTEADTPTNLISNADGIIKKINVKSGTCTVKVGDAVLKGDILVSGIIEGKNSNKYVNSRGEIIAVVNKTFTVSKKLKQVKSIKKEKKYTAKLIKLYNVYMPLYFHNRPNNVKEEQKTENVTLFGKKLPITYYCKNYYEYKKIYTLYNYNTVCEMIENEVKSKCGAVKCNITSADFKAENGNVTANITVKYEKNIAISDKLLISSGKK